MGNDPHDSLYICAYLIFGYDVLLRAVKHIGQGKVFDENFDVLLYDWRVVSGEMARLFSFMLFHQVVRHSRNMGGTAQIRKIHYGIAGYPS